jgi:hypothetical protein
MDDPLTMNPVGLSIPLSFNRSRSFHVPIPPSQVVLFPHGGFQGRELCNFSGLCRVKVGRGRVSCFRYGPLLGFCPRSRFCFCRSAFALEAIDFPDGSSRDRPFVSLLIPSSVVNSSEDCFAACRSVSSVGFESGSKLLGIELPTFDSCSSLSSIRVVELSGDDFDSHPATLSP